MGGDCSRVAAALAEFGVNWRCDAWTPAAPQSARIQSYARGLAGLQLTGGESCLLLAPLCLSPALLLAQLAGRVRLCLTEQQSSQEWRQALADAGVESVEVLSTSATQGAPDHAPYHAIFVASPVSYLRPGWLDQLALDARLVAPVGSLHAAHWQVHLSTEQRIERQADLGAARFSLDEDCQAAD